jgi:Ca-activated chloride channel homolog
MISYNNIYLGFLGLIGLIFWMISFTFKFRKSEITLPSKYIKKSSNIFRLAIGIIGITAWLLISYSLTGPKKPLGHTKNKIEVNDIFFVVDVSRSMLAEDFIPNRLEAAKQKIVDFVSLRPTDRIGIVIFSERAFTLLPLSTDLDLIKRVTKEEIKIGFLGSGTNIGDALGLAVARGAQSLAKNKVIILLTDGVSNNGNMTPIQAAEEAAKHGIKVYAIGIGGDKNARIPLPGNYFGRKRYQNIPGGSIDIETLKKISGITGGKDYIASDIEALENVLQEIQALEKTEIDSSSRVIYEELYWEYFFAGLFLFLIAEVLRRSMLKEAI